MGCKDKFDRKLVEELLEGWGVDAIFLIEGYKGGKRAAQGSGCCEVFIVVAARAMVLFSGIDEVKIDGEGAYDVDGGIEVTTVDYVGDFLIECGHFML